jgi:MFS-type transporter involved in bile tolerance (Atg22 family)
MLITASELTANPGKGGTLSPLVTQMRDVLSAESGGTWYAWAAVTGRPYGTYILSTRFDDYATMIASQMKVAMSPAWAELAAKAEGVLANPAPTVLSEIVGVVGERSAPKQFTLVTRAVIDRTALQAASAWAAQVAEYVHASTGIGVTIGSSAAGQMFVVSWLSSVDTPADLDKLSALGSDAGYLELISAAGPLFEQGATERMLLARLP